jgi:SAM-dependent methyltransferase
MFPRTFEDWNILLRRVLGGGNHAKIFDNYYKADSWIGGGSGSGSTLDSTALYREFLANFIRQNEVTSVLDLGCGDWQFSKLMDWTGIDYIGVDVSRVILKNTSKYARPGIRFIELDGRSCDLPGADLLIVKDVLQHWSNFDIARLLPLFKRFRFVLKTDCSERNAASVNANIKPGLCRPVDLTRSPFNMTGKVVLEYTYQGEKKSIFLWERDR